jgi:hypothetical protein
MGMGYRVAPLGDDFNRLSGRKMENNFLARDEGFMGVGRLALNALVSDDGTALLQVDYISKGWMFIRSGESLVLLLDGDRVGVAGPGSIASRHVISGSAVTETANYPVSMDLLRRIAAARQVRVRVVGSERTMDLHFSRENKARFEAFVGQAITSSDPARVVAP